MTAVGQRVAWIFGLAAAGLLVALAPPASEDGLALGARTQRVELRVDAAVGAGKDSRDPAARATSSGEPLVLLIKPRTAPGDGGGQAPPLFAATRWSAPPASAAVATALAATPAAPAPPPQAPALPFRVIGHYDDGGRTAFFLQQDDRNFVVHVGDEVNELYKVERLDGSTLTLRYLPLNQLQSLDIGGGA